MRKEVARAILWGVIITTLEAITIWLGSRNLAHFDAALVAYTFATLFATFGITYRFTIWLQRPPTAMYWKRGWQAFLRPKYLAGNIVNWFRRVPSDVALNSFIRHRDTMRWAAHMLLMWGCLIAIGITFPLVFGWIHFETLPDNFAWYRVFLFGFPTFAFPIHSILGFTIFHGLVWSAIMVIGGVMLAMRRRMRAHDAGALQMFGEDILPLVLLFAVSLTGLMLTASYSWMKGYAFDFLGILHAITVIFTLLWLPFGKFFHIFQRPAQLGVSFYKDVGEKEAHAACRRCGAGFSSEMHVRDLIEVQQQLGFNYEIKGTTEHYQWICPPCRRALFVLAQGRLWQAETVSLETGSQYGNTAIGQGPLGAEDQRNFHP